MPIPSAKQRIVDIVTNIRKARSYIATIDQDAFEQNDVIQDAVLRRLQNASETLTRLRAEHPREYERLVTDTATMSGRNLTVAAVAERSG